MISFLILLIFAVFRVVPMIIAGVVARKKKRSVVLWVVFGFFLPLPALIAIFLVAPLVPCIQCAQCKRYSWATAKSCPFCNIPMPEGPIEQAPDPAGRSTATVAVIVLAIGFFMLMFIGILAAVAIPKFAELTSRSQEASAKGQLGAVRSALAIYYGDTNGKYPKNLQELTAHGKYLKDLPAITLPKTPRNAGHPRSAAVTYGRLSEGVTDKGGWFYDTGGDALDRKIVINCSHQDSKGKRWDAY